MQNRVKREDLRLDITFIKKRKANLEEKLKAVQFYVTEKDICRTRLLIKYFGEKSDEDCGICDVCAERKKAPVTNRGFAEIVAALENELKQSPLTAQQIKTKLKIQDPDFDKVIDFLTDAGKITWSAELNLTWVG